MEQIINGLQDVLVSIILALLSLGGAYAIYCINKLCNKLRAESCKLNNDTVQKLATSAINIIDSTVVTVVNSLEQEVASEIRKKIESGDVSVSRNDLVKLRDEALNTVISIVGPEVIDNSKILIGDINEYTLNKISEEVLFLKTSGTSERLLESQEN